jgi:hypothetical protein
VRNHLFLHVLLHVLLLLLLLLSLCVASTVRAERSGSSSSTRLAPRPPEPAPVPPGCCCIPGTPPLTAGSRDEDDTVLLVDEVDIYDAPRFRYRCPPACCVMADGRAGRHAGLQKCRLMQRMHVTGRMLSGACWVRQACPPLLYPRCCHCVRRGLMIDTARHYLPISVIKVRPRHCRGAGASARATGLDGASCLLRSPGQSRYWCCVGMGS